VRHLVRHTTGTDTQMIVERFTSCLRRFTKRRPGTGFLAEISGTTAIEFAMISVPFIGLIGAIFETGMTYFRTAQLQMATESASRAVLTHSTAAGLTYQQFVDQYVCTWQASGTVKSGTLSTMFDCSKLMVSIDSPTSWDTAASGYTSNTFTAAPRTQTIAMPAAGKIAIVRVVYPATVIMGFLGGSVFKNAGITPITSGQTQYNNAWTYMLLGIAAFRVEP
jgi:Flp pilus assembly protein TadG